MKRLILSIAFISCLGPAVEAMDNGPSVAGCEWGFGKKLKTDSCLIVGSGLMMGGVNLMAVIIGKQPGMYVFEDDHAALYEGDTVDSKKLWEGTVELEETQCRPGSVVAQRYHASNGLTVCIYR